MITPHQVRVDRVARRYLTSAIQSDGLIHPDEVLGFRIEEQDLGEHLDDFLSTIIQEGQKAHKRVKEATRVVQGYYPKDKLDRRALGMALRKRMEHRWGSDVMLPLLVRMVMDGDFVY